MRMDSTDRVQGALGRRISSIHVEQHMERFRDVESWIVSTSANPLPPVSRAVLLGVHMSVHDYFAIHPFLVVPIPHRLTHGEVFRDVFLLEPGVSVPNPRDIQHFLVNGSFMRQCVPRDMVFGEESVQIHSLDGIEMLFGSETFFAQLSTHTRNCGLMCIGVVGQDPAHVLRGKLEKDAC